MASPVKSEWTSVAVPGGAFFDAYLARPPAGNGPGLVLFQEIFGVNEHIRTVADQYALDGFVVLAPDVFWRSQRRVELGYEGEDRQRGIQLAGQLKGPELGLDMVATVTALRSRPEVDNGKVGAIGYCMGGRLAFLAAATAGVDAAVAFTAAASTINSTRPRASSARCCSTTPNATTTSPQPRWTRCAPRCTASLPRCMCTPARCMASIAGLAPRTTHRAPRSRMDAACSSWLTTCSRAWFLPAAGGRAAGRRSTPRAAVVAWGTRCP